MRAVTAPMKLSTLSLVLSAVLALSYWALNRPSSPPPHAAQIGPSSTRIEPRPVRVLVKALSTSNLTLSGAQTVDGVSVVANDLVAAVGQSNSKNAIYLAKDTDWIVVDPGIGTGLEVYALGGSSNGNTIYGCDTTGAITWGTTSTTFTKKASSGTTFNAAAPGAIGGTTPAAGTFTTLAGTTSTTSPVLVVSAGDPIAGSAGTTKLWRSNVIATDHLALKGGTGDSFTIKFESGSGTSDIRKRYWTKSLADDATFDITVGGGGHGTITAPGASGSTSCSFSFAANATTTDNGLTGTNCAVADTDTKLCAFVSAGALRIKNRLGSTQTILIELTESVSN